jgi:hypothetical protein
MNNEEEKCCEDLRQPRAKIKRLEDDTLSTKLLEIIEGIAAFSEMFNE